VNRKKYQTGIQKAVLHVIEISKKLGLLYITKQQIMQEVSKIVQLKDPKTDSKNQVGQALYQLQHKSKYRRPRIKKYIDKEGNMLGWTSIKEYFDRFRID